MLSLDWATCYNTGKSLCLLEGTMERSFLLRNGDRLVCTEQAATFTFSGPRAVLSTAANGGGLR